MPYGKPFYFLLFFSASLFMFSVQAAFGFNQPAGPNIMLSPKITLQHKAVQLSLSSAVDKGAFDIDPIELEEKIANGSSLKIKASSVEKLIEMAEQASPETFEELFSALVRYLSHQDKSIRNSILRWIFKLASNDPNRIITLLESLQKENPNDNIHYHIERVLQTLSLNNIWKTRSIDPSPHGLIPVSI